MAIAAASAAAAAAAAAAASQAQTAAQQTHAAQQTSSTDCAESVAAETSTRRPLQEVPHHSTSSAQVQKHRHMHLFNASQRPIIWFYCMTVDAKALLITCADMTGSFTSFRSQCVLMMGRAHSSRGRAFHPQACRVLHSVSSRILPVVEGQRKQHSSHPCRKQCLQLQVSVVHQLRIFQS